jgi:hypothetical protein
MDLNLAFTDSAAGHALLVALTFVLLKLIATVIQVVMLRGDYRNMPKTLFYRSVYITGKVTPAFWGNLCIHRRYSSTQSSL